MDVFWRAYEYALKRQDEFIQAVQQHLLLVGFALGGAMLFCLPLGLWSARSRGVSLIVLTTINAVRVIPSLVMLFLTIPYFGLSFLSSAIALTILALPPVLINTDIAFRSINPAILEAARGMGMAPGEVFWWVEVPLALPVIVAGIRTAMVEVIASATLAAFVGGGGLGVFIARGFALYDQAISLVGAVPVALLALSAEVVMGGVQRFLQPPGYSGSNPQ